MGDTITIEVQLFARLRELCGDRSSVDAEVPTGATAAQCFEELCGRFEALASYRDALAVAVNDEYATWERELQPGDVVAFIPPVSGGSGMPRFAVLDVPISAAELRDLVAGAGNGAVCTFEGTVRDHTGGTRTSHLEYEASAALATQVFADIAAAAARRWGVDDVAIHHRVGRLEIGDVSVAIAVAAEHRGAAFEACRYAIDQLKVSAPIWKKEFGPDGSYWVEGPRVTPVPEQDGE